MMTLEDAINHEQVNGPLWSTNSLMINRQYYYAAVKDHPKANKNGLVYHHRMVAENKIGRILESDEVVHHVNRNSRDNRPENLKVLSPNEHASSHKEDHVSKMAQMTCPVCEEIFSCRYGNSNFTPSKSHLGPNLCSIDCKYKMLKMNLAPTFKEKGEYFLGIKYRRNDILYDTREQAEACGGFLKHERCVTDEIYKALKSKHAAKNFVCKHCKSAFKTKQKNAQYCCQDCAKHGSEKFSPSLEELEALVSSGMPMTKIGIKYGVSDNAVRKRLKKLRNA